MKVHTCFRIFCLNFFILTALLSVPLGETAGQDGFLHPADSFDRTRFWTLNSGLTAGYGLGLYQLNRLWYDRFKRSSLHSFDDHGEWRDVDKGGHFFASYIESRFAYSLYNWTGTQERTAAFIGAGWGFGAQLGFELLDGFTDKWGFSWYDIMYNSAGSGLFLAQQLAWNEQRIRVKYSLYPVSYPDIDIPADRDGAPYPLNRRIEELYGNGLERLLKDYNGHTVWLSVNPSSFVQGKALLPPWLNIALGYGAENMYGGFSNHWSADGKEYSHPAERVGQLFLSPDIDLDRIKTKSSLLRILLDVLNIIKIPLPTLEYRTSGQWSWHWMYF